MGARKPLQKTYIVSWYGPFHSIEEMTEWQRQQNSIYFGVYLIQGKKPNAKMYSYYCGRTKRTVPERFNDKDHHIQEIPNSRNIWIGTVETSCSQADIVIVEKLCIYLLSTGVNEAQCLNNRSLYFPAQDYNVLLVNKWHNPKRYRQPECSVKLVFPEVVAYFADTDELKLAKKLHSL